MGIHLAVQFHDLTWFVLIFHSFDWCLIKEILRRSAGDELLTQLQDLHGADAPHQLAEPGVGELEEGGAVRLVSLPAHVWAELVAHRHRGVMSII